MGVGLAARLEDYEKKVSDLDTGHKSDSEQSDAKLELLNGKVNQLQTLLGNEEVANVMAPEQLEGSQEIKELTDETKTDETNAGEAKAREDSVIDEVSHEVDGMLAEVKEEQSQTTTREPQSEEVIGQNERSDREQLAQADEGQRTLQNEGFVPITGTAKKQSRVGKFFRGLGHMLYSGIVALTAPVGYLIGRVVRLFGKRTAQQQSRIQRLIPGSTGNELFPEYQIDETDHNQKIENDTRRVPLVWEQKIPENPDQSPRISIMIDQPKEGSVDSMNGSEMGHAMIGLFYSRLNRYSGQMERYRLKYGFYPKGGFVTGNSTYTMVMSGMLMPGQLRNDRAHSYTVAKTFDLTNDKINKVLRMSENYPQGGYGYFKRNCTTFAKDAAEEANVNVENVFEETDVNFSTNSGLTTLLSFGTLGAGLLNNSMNEGVMNHMYNKSKVDDLSYAGFGQKLATTDDIQRASKSRSLNERMRGLAPGIAGENIRFGEGTGLDSMGYEPSESFSDDLMKPGKIRNYLEAEATKLCAALKKRGVQDAVVEELRRTMTEKNTDVSGKYNNMLEAQTSPMLREAADHFNEYQNYLNEVYQTQFGQDAELNIPFQHMFAVLQNYKQVLYNMYGTMDDELDFDRDTYRYLTFLSDRRKLEIKDDKGAVPGTETAGQTEQKSTTIRITTAEQAALIQQFGSLQAGSKFLNKFYELNAKTDLTKREKRQFARLERQAATYLDFINAQTSFVNRENFMQGDMDLAFIRLPKGMEGVVADESNKNQMVTNAYQALAYEKVFGGMKLAFRNYLQANEIKERKDLDIPGTKERIEEWSFQYLYNKASGHQQPLQMIVNSFCQRMSGEKDGEIVRAILKSIGEVYLAQILQESSLNLEVPMLEEYNKTGTVGRLADLLARMVQTYQAGQAASA